MFAEWPTFFSWLQMAIYFWEIQLLSSNVNFLKIILFCIFKSQHM